MVRDLDIAMNGDGAAPQAMLCDLMPQLIQLLTTEQNFCPRCGKRTNDIHTCTPPMEQNHG